MKKISFLFFLVLVISCTKSTDPGSPYVEILLGTKTLGVYETFVPFKSQDTIYRSKLDSIDVIRIVVIEKNVDSSYFLGTSRKPTFNFHVATRNDKEYFISDQNCWLCSFGGGGDNINKIHILQGEIQFPIKISQVITKNNDTLEFREDNDYIVVTYLSLYTRASIKDSTIIIPY